MSELSTIFGPTGALAKRIEGFRHRTSQIEMAEKIEAAIDRAGVLIAEAGTGTGKTFAYLVPALRSGGKVIISTGTKTLQDQLFHRDIPTVIAALGIPVSTALLKGRANYVCLHHLEEAVADGRFMNREDVKHIAVIRRFAERSLSGGGTGDKAELPDVPERSNVILGFHLGATDEATRTCRSRWDRSRRWPAVYGSVRRVGDRRIAAGTSEPRTRT